MDTDMTCVCAWIKLHRRAIAVACLLLGDMVSALDKAKRALVTLIKHLATLYSIVVNVDRERADKDVSAAGPMCILWCLIL